jgi:hypothetical protein
MNSGVSGRAQASVFFIQCYQPQHLRRNSVWSTASMPIVASNQPSVPLPRERFRASKSPRSSGQRGGYYAAAAPRPLRSAHSASHSSHRLHGARTYLSHLPFRLLRKHLAPTADYPPRASSFLGGQRVCHGGGAIDGAVGDAANDFRWPQGFAVRSDHDRR